MIYLLHALGGTVSEEIYRSAVKILAVGVGRNDVGAHFPHCLQRPVIYGGVHLHAACVNHGTQQRALFHLLSEKHRNRKQLECRNREQLQITAVAHSLCHRHAYAQSCVRARTACHGNRIERYGMAVGKRQCLVDKRTEFHCMIRTTVIFITVYAGSVLTDCHRTHVGACLNM